MRYCSQQDYDGNYCTNPVHAHDLCDAHYYRMRKGKDMLEPIVHKRPRNMTDNELIDYIYDNCEPAYDCMIWQLRVNGNSCYPTLWDDKKKQNIMLRRFLYENKTGYPLAKGEQIASTCGNDLCLNVDHLERRYD